MSFLGFLEEYHRKSKDFNYDTTLLSFIEHLNHMKSVGFNVNDVFHNENFTPAYLCSADNRVALLRALYFVGADFNKEFWFERGNNSLPGSRAVHSIVHPDLPIDKSVVSLTNECIQTLFLCEADLDAEGYSLNVLTHSTVLWLAATLGQSEITKTLAQLGCNVNHYNSQYGQMMTPLHVAAREGHLETVKILIQYGADKNLKTSDGSTPLDLAKEMKHQDIVEFLKGL
jgi:hypothetical protein